MSEENYQQPQQPTYQQSQMPQEASKWNWGAFLFNIWWGIGNRAYLSLLCLIPIFGFIWIFVCGAMGNKWAWQSGNYHDVDLFHAVQEPWNRAGKVYFIISIIILVLYLIIGMVAGFSFLAFWNK